MTLVDGKNEQTHDHFALTLATTHTVTVFRPSKLTLVERPPPPKSITRFALEKRRL